MAREGFSVWDEPDIKQGDSITITVNGESIERTVDSVYELGNGYWRVDLGYPWNELLTPAPEEQK